MATAAKTYTFTSGTTAVAAEVNQNFDDLVGFINTNAIQKDGSLAMTADLSLKNAEPGSSNVAVRRKSAYRSNLSAHPSLDTFTVAGGTAGVITTVGTVTNQFGYTPDYDYTLIVLLTGNMTSTAAGQGIEIALDSPSGTPISVFGGGVNNHFKWVPGASNEYSTICHVGRVNYAAAVVPTYTVRYRVLGVTAFTCWITGFSWIVPQTRQLPN